MRAEKRPEWPFQFLSGQGFFLTDLAYFFLHKMASFGPLYNSGGMAVDFFGLRLCFNNLIGKWP